MPHPRPKMNSWFSSALASVVTSVIHKRHARPADAVEEARASPTPPRPRRRHRRAGTRRPRRAARSRRQSRRARGSGGARHPTSRKTRRRTRHAPQRGPYRLAGTLCSAGHRSSAPRVSAPPCPRRRAPGRPTMMSHCTAPTAASALVEMRPMNHMSVRLRTICTALLAMSGSASASTGALVDVRSARRVDALRRAGAHGPSAGRAVLADWYRGVHGNILINPSFSHTHSNGRLRHGRTPQEPPPASHAAHAAGSPRASRAAGSMPRRWPWRSMIRRSPSLPQLVRAAGGAPIGAYREPLGGRAAAAGEPAVRGRAADALPARPVARRTPSAWRRRSRQTAAFLDPLIVVRGEDGRLWTPNGRHRLAAAKVLGLKQITALISGDDSLAYRILALNTEKAHNLKDRSLEVIRMARNLAKRRGREREEQFAARVRGRRTADPRHRLRKSAALCRRRLQRLPEEGGSLQRAHARGEPAAARGLCGAAARDRRAREGRHRRAAGARLQVPVPAQLRRGADQPGALPQGQEGRHARRRCRSPRRSRAWRPRRASSTWARCPIPISPGWRSGPPPNRRAASARRVCGAGVLGQRRAGNRHPRSSARSRRETGPAPRAAHPPPAGAAWPARRTAAGRESHSAPRRRARSSTSAMPPPSGPGSQAATKLSAALSSAFTHSGRPDRNTATTGTSSACRRFSSARSRLSPGCTQASARRRRTPRTGSRRIPRSPRPGACGTPRGARAARLPPAAVTCVRDAGVDRSRRAGSPGSARCPASRSSSRRFAWRGCRPRHR